MRCGRASITNHVEMQPTCFEATVVMLAICNGDAVRTPMASRKARTEGPTNHGSDMRRQNQMDCKAAMKRMIEALKAVCWNALEQAHATGG